MIEDSEVNLDVFEVKKKLLKSDLKHKTRYHFHDFVNAVHNFVNAVHNCERRSQFSIVNVAATTRIIVRFFLFANWVNYRKIMEFYRFSD